MPAPIIPAPSTPTLAARNVSATSGREAPPFTAFRSNQNA